MRHPRRLLRDLGWRRFAGMQVLFLGTLSQLALAPLIWTHWLPLLGLPHPLAEVLPAPVLAAFAVLFVLSTATEITIHAWAARASGKSGLIRWIPALALYYPLATLACWRGIAQILHRPFFWDKTAHGIFATTDTLTPPSGPWPRPVSDG
jgi:hypothetical protein